MNEDKITQTIIGEGIAIGEVSQGGTLIINQSKGSKAKLRDLEFIKSVKFLLELYGFTCSVNRLLNGIVVDLWGEYSVGIGAYQAAIACIDSDGLVEPEVINEVQWNTFGPLSDKLTTARKLVVSATGFSQEAITLLSKYNIEYLSYGDILSKLIDFRFYLESLVESWMSDKLRHYYIPMRAEQEGKRQSKESIKLERYVREFIEDNSRRSLAILGEYGTGKTTLSRLIAYEQARKYLRACFKSPRSVLVT